MFIHGSQAYSIFIFLFYLLLFIKQVIRTGNEQALDKLLESGLCLADLKNPLYDINPEAEDNRQMICKIIDIFEKVHNENILQRQDERGNTALHYYASQTEKINNYRECAAILLSKGANINAVNHNLDTPAHCAYRATTNLEDDQYKKQWYYLFLAFEANLELPNSSGEIAFKKYTENSKKQRMTHARNRSTSPTAGTSNTNV